ncbi:hypothetical protein H4684_001959 [Desulfomicrobium macestii]|uniref:CULT domain-containing protein n=1 Tax=Desulfomicrobium macestii TaxID=90731 RepID=A0ABR9H3L5_9BACT|nr:cereblon family protein [Desulfomicrobium macestii]MBE1425306.1 hypothetical protein [Desulfomicrobium macestii]
MPAMDVPAYFRESDFPAQSPVLADLDSPELDESGRGALLCRTCGQPVTRIRDRISVGGKHVHALFNPAGILFEVGCFAVAPGCRFEGEFTHDFSWFPGYAWRYAMCRRCAVHLGWEYRGAGDGFTGLIMAFLRESGS